MANRKKIVAFRKCRRCKLYYCKKAGYECVKEDAKAIAEKKRILTQAGFCVQIYESFYDLDACICPPCAQEYKELQSGRQSFARGRVTSHYRDDPGPGWDNVVNALEEDS